MWVTQEGAPLTDAILDKLRVDHRAAVIQLYNAETGQYSHAVASVGPDDYTPGEDDDPVALLAQELGTQFEAWLEQQPGELDSIRVRVGASNGPRSGSALKSLGSLTAYRASAAPPRRGASQGASFPLADAMLLSQLNRTIAILTERNDESAERNGRMLEVAIGAIERTSNLSATMVDKLLAMVEKLGSTESGAREKLMYDLEELRQKHTERIIEAVGDAAAPLVEGASQKFLGWERGNDGE